MCSEVKKLLEALKRSNKELIVITGCGRSGTAYIAKVMQHVGKEVLHEQIGQDGVSAWQLAPFERPQNCLYLHQVRHPLHAISSMQTISTRSWDFIASFIKLSDNRLLNCMRYWYFWNLFAECKADWTYKVEDVPTLWPQFQKLLQVSKPLPNVSTTTNSRRGMYKPVSWGQLEETDAELACRIRELAQRYGYQL